MRGYLIFGAIALSLLSCNQHSTPLHRQIQVEREQGVPIGRLEMVMGISDRFRFHRNVGPIYLTRPELVEFRRIKSEGVVRELLLIPKKPGVTDMTVHDRRSQVMKKIYIEVKPSEDVRARERKIASFAKTRKMELIVGVGFTLDMLQEFGPIYLTDPSLFDFRRIRHRGRASKILLIPKKAGVTDMTIHDVRQLPLQQFIVYVRPSPTGEKSAWKRPRPKVVTPVIADFELIDQEQPVDVNFRPKQRRKVQSKGKKTSKVLPPIRLPTPECFDILGSNAKAVY